MNIDARIMNKVFANSILRNNILRNHVFMAKSNNILRNYVFIVRFNLFWGPKNDPIIGNLLL